MYSVAGHQMQRVCDNNSIEEEKKDLTVQDFNSPLRLSDYYSKAEFNCFTVSYCFNQL